MATRMGWSPGPAAWKNDLTPIAAADWNYDRAAHLLAHAGFGGTPADIQKLADAGLDRAVRSLVHYENVPNPLMQLGEHRFAPQLLLLVIEHHPLQVPRAGNLARTHSSHEHVPLPARKLVPRIDRHPRRRNRGNPEHHREFPSFPLCSLTTICLALA